MFASRSGNRDAGPLIGPRVHWMLAAGRPNPASVAGMTLDPSVIGTLGDGWMHAGPDVWSGIEFGWMVSLAEYDYWDVDRNAVPPEPDSWSDTEPDSRELWAWSKLRIAKGVHEHALAPALAEVQELARLCLTVERFPTQLAGIAMLRQVRRAAEAEAPALSSRTADAESTDRMLRAISAARGFARLEISASYEADLAKVVVGRCAALHDGLRTALLVRAQLREGAQRTTNTWSACCRLRPTAVSHRFANDGRFPTMNDRPSRSLGWTASSRAGAARSCSRLRSRTGSVCTRSVRPSPPDEGGGRRVMDHRPRSGAPCGGPGACRRRAAPPSHRRSSPGPR